MGANERFSFPPLTVSYSDSVFNPLGIPATLSKPTYEYFVNKPSLTVEEPGLTLEVPSIKCKIHVLASKGLGTGSREIEYTDKGGDVVITSKITKLSYKVTEDEFGVCSYYGSEGSNGTLSGEVELGIENNSLELGYY